MLLRPSISLAALLCLLFFAPSQAKCPWALIHIRGNINGKAPAGVHFDFSVESTTPGDSQKKIRQESAIHGSNFEATLYFDTFESMHNGTHVCARKPRAVTLSLVSASQTISKEVLTIQNDFRRTEEGDYEILQPLVVPIASGEN